MKIEIWGDVVCPYCYIGKANLAIALRQFAHAEDVVVLNRAFELDPRFDKHSILTVEQAAARKYGMTPQQTEAAERRLQQSAREGSGSRLLCRFFAQRLRLRRARVGNRWWPRRRGGEFVRLAGNDREA
jgi:predicted DsbA family dithiol-disulfide isomerase